MRDGADYPAIRRDSPEAPFSRHSREQYSEDLEPGPTARSAGIHVPQLTQRTSLFSVLMDLPLVADCPLAFSVSLIVPVTLRTSSI